MHGFLDTIREGHPTTPLLVVSPILCPIHEDTPGPAHAGLRQAERGPAAASSPRATPRTATRADAAASSATSSRASSSSAAVDDPHLHYLDGRELYGEADVAELPLPDALHPDAATHRRIGERFASLAFAVEGPLAVG